MLTHCRQCKNEIPAREKGRPGRSRVFCTLACQRRARDARRSKAGLFKTDAYRERRRNNQKQDHRKETRAAYLRRRRRESPEFRLHHRVSKGVRRMLTQQTAERLEVLLGYTIADLRSHLERQFKRGMTWVNYGTAWHIDHIIPRRLFSADEWRACWSLSNLRPLHAVDNISKGGARQHLL